MPRIKYKEHRFGGEALLLIDRVNGIAADYARQGFSLTLRQIYYQLVSRDVIPNNLQSYSRLGDIISDARLAGRIDWDTVVDRTRNLASESHWKDPESIIDICAKTFAYDKWEEQPYHVEVWVEKDALSDVVRHACQPLDVSYMACKGYMSISEMWAAGRRLKYSGKNNVIIHLGDHDPSGINMTSDIMGRLAMFAEEEIIVERIALNMDQVEEFNPPANPAKTTDSRFQAYMEQFGDQSWELDAIPPESLSALITDKILEYRDEELWEGVSERQDRARELLSKVSKQWDKVVEVVG